MNIFNLFFMLRIAIKHWVALVVAAAITATAAFTYFNFIAEPKFSATGSIIVTNGTIIAQSEYANENEKIENADITTSLSFAETVTDILETSGIYKELASQIGDSYTYTQLQSMASVYRRNEDTLFIDVTFIATSREEAVSLVNQYLSLAPDYISGKVTNTATDITFADYAQEVYLNTITVTVLAGILGAAVVYLIIFLIYSSDSIIRDEESFRERFDIPIIGVIPDFASAKTKEGKYYRYSKYYGYGYGGNKYAK